MGTYDTQRATAGHHCTDSFSTYYCSTPGILFCWKIKTTVAVWVVEDFAETPTSKLLVIPRSITRNARVHIVVVLPQVLLVRPVTPIYCYSCCTQMPARDRATWCTPSRGYFGQKERLWSFSYIHFCVLFFQSKEQKWNWNKNTGQQQSAVCPAGVISYLTFPVHFWARNADKKKTKDTIIRSPTFHIWLDY